MQLRSRLKSVRVMAGQSALYALILATILLLAVTVVWFYFRQSTTMEMAWFASHTAAVSERGNVLSSGELLYMLM